MATTTQWRIYKLSDLCITNEVIVLYTKGIHNE